MKDGVLRNSNISSFLLERCNKTICSDGKMCRVNGDGEPECHCPTECSEDKDPHCSVFLLEYGNLCEVHRHACKMQMNVAVKHKGRCGGMIAFQLVN